MADKIDQLKIGSTSYDIDLPVDATPSIASLTTSGNVTVGGSLAKGNLTFTLPSSSGTLTLDENLPIVSFGTQTISGATEIKSITVGTDDYNLGGGGTGTVTSVGAGTGLSITGTATVNPTVNIADGYKLLTTTDWKNDSVYSVMNASSVAGSTTSGAVLSVRWYVSGVDGITTPYNGMKIAIKIPRAGVSTGGALLSINGNTDADYHPVAYNVNTVFTSHYAVNTIKYLTYDATATMTGYVSAGTATTITGVWKFDADYDSNTTITYGTLAYYYRPYMAAYLSPYQLVVVDKDNRLVPLSTTQFPAYSSSTTYASDVYVYYSNVIYKSLQASNKNHTPNSSTSWWAAQTTPHTPTAAAFKPDKIYWYTTTTAISAGSAIGGNTLMSVGYNQPNMAICNFNSTITSYRMIYLRGTYNRTTGLFTLKSGGTAGTTNYYTLVPDNTANLTLSSYFTSGEDYILIGASYSSNNYLHLREDHPMFHFDGTNLVPYDTYNENRVEGLIPSTYVSTVNGSSGAITNVAKTNADNSFSVSQTFSNGLTTTGANLKLNKISAPTSSGGSTYGNGSSGQILKSNGTTVYWANESSGPSTYLKTASTSSNTLTLTKQDNTTVTFSPVAIDASVASNTLIFANTGASNYGNIALVTTTATSQELSPNVFYQWSTSGFSSNITVTFGSAISGIVNEYMWEVTTGGTAITITTPSSVIWADDSNVTKSSNVLTLATNCAYQFSVVNNLGLISSFPVSGTRSLNVQQNGSNLSWGDGNEQR